MATGSMLANTGKGRHSCGQERAPDVAIDKADQAGRIVALVLIGITAMRVLALGLTPLGPDVEEAQYWLWSQTPMPGISPSRR